MLNENFKIMNENEISMSLANP